MRLPVNNDDLTTMYESLIEILSKHGEFGDVLSWVETLYSKAKFGQPSEKKALSVDDIKKVIKNEVNHIWVDKGETVNEYRFSMSHLDSVAQAIFDALPAQREVSESCGCCGSKMVYIRGKFPKEDNRLICPCCAYERLEQINDISNKDYGKSYQAIGDMKKLNGG